MRETERGRKTDREKGGCERKEKSVTEIDRKKETSTRKEKSVKETDRKKERN